MNQKEKDTIKRIKEKYKDWIGCIDDGGICKDSKKKPKPPKLGRNEQKKEQDNG